ncbi:hypothetical protein CAUPRSCDRAFT_7952, partial [Caulochytrium protostelioides]
MAVDKAQYDLTLEMAKHLDPHLILPLLDHLQENEMYPVKDILKAKLAIVEQTDMAGHHNEIWQELNETENDVPGHSERTQKALETFDLYERENQPLFEMIKDPNVASQLKSDKQFNIQLLTEEHGFKVEMLDKFYEGALFQYAIGQYASASDMLYHLLILSTDAEKIASAMWGKLASDILNQDWPTALEQINSLKEFIDQREYGSPVEQLQQRTWLVTWALFVFFNHDNGREKLLELFLQPTYLNVIQTAVPWMLRYITISAVIQKKQRGVLKELIRLIRNEVHVYRDPVVDFVEALFVDYDFETAQTKLAQCGDLIASDFFVQDLYELFLENARLLMFENYCRIHQVLDITELSERLNMAPDAGEKWIVNLIRDARMDAKIDAATNTVVIRTQCPTIHAQIMDKTHWG